MQTSSPVSAFWQGKVQNSSPISAPLRCRHFPLSVCLSLSLSHSLSLSLSAPHAQYRKRYRASYNEGTFCPPRGIIHFRKISRSSVREDWDWWSPARRNFPSLNNREVSLFVFRSWTTYVVQATLFVGSSQGFLLYVVRLPRTVSLPVGRINSRAVPFLSLLWAFPWFHCVGGTHFDNTGTKLLESAWNAQKCSVFRTMLKAHFQRGSHTKSQMTCVVQNRTTVLVPKHDSVQRILHWNTPQRNPYNVQRIAILFLSEYLN